MSVKGAALMTSIPRGWQLRVELEAITWNDLYELVKIAEAVEMLDSGVDFQYTDDEAVTRTHIILEMEP